MPRLEVKCIKNENFTLSLRVSIPSSSTISNIFNFTYAPIGLSYPIQPSLSNAAGAKKDHVALDINGHISPVQIQVRILPFGRKNSGFGDEVIF